MGSITETFMNVMSIAIKKFQDGGPVMYVLLALSILGMAFVCDRIIVILIQQMKLSPKGFLRKANSILEQKEKPARERVDEMIAFLEKKGGVTSNIMSEAAYKWKEARDANFNMLELKTFIQSNVDEKAIMETPVLEARMGGLGSVAAIAPLVGLLGTVTGMIASFDVMANSPAGAKPDELAGGISMALITTAGGLIVAIPILMIHGMLKAWVDGRIAEIEESAKQFVDELVHLHDEPMTEPEPESEPETDPEPSVQPA